MTTEIKDRELNNLHKPVGWASRPPLLEGRDAHPTITIKIASYLILIPKQAWVQRFSIGSLLLILTTGLLSCGNLPLSQLNLGLNVASIGDIQQKRQVDGEVYLRGKVENRAPFVGNAAYQLQDGTGKIWILTKQDLPKLGDEVLLKGEVRYKSITLKELAGKDLGEVYIEEMEQLNRTPAADKEK